MAAALLHRDTTSVSAINNFSYVKSIFENFSGLPEHLKFWVRLMDEIHDRPNGLIKYFPENCSYSAAGRKKREKEERIQRFINWLLQMSFEQYKAMLLKMLDDMRENIERNIEIIDKYIDAAEHMLAEHAPDEKSKRYWRNAAERLQTMRQEYVDIRDHKLDQLEDDIEDAQDPVELPVAETMERIDTVQEEYDRLSEKTKNTVQSQNVHAHNHFSSQLSRLFGRHADRTPDNDNKAQKQVPDRDRMYDFTSETHNTKPPSSNKKEDDDKAENGQKPKVKNSKGTDDPDENAAPSPDAT